MVDCSPGVKRFESSATKQGRFPRLTTELWGHGVTPNLFGSTCDTGGSDPMIRCRPRSLGCILWELYTGSASWILKRARWEPAARGSSVAFEFDAE